MDINGILLILVGILELLLGIYIYSRDSNNSINISFSLLTLGVLLWVGVNAKLSFSEDSFLTNMYRLAYFSGIIISSIFLYFSWVFPYRLFKTNWVRKLLVVTPIAVFAVLFFTTNALVISAKQFNNIVDVEFGSLFYVFVIIFTGYFLWAFIELFRKLMRSDGMHSWQLRYVIISALIPVTINLFMDIILPWAGYGREAWMVYLGAESSIIWLALTGYVVFKNNI